MDTSSLAIQIYVLVHYLQHARNVYAFLLYTARISLRNERVLPEDGTVVYASQSIVKPISPKKASGPCANGYSLDLNAKSERIDLPLRLYPSDHDTRYRILGVRAPENSLFIVCTPMIFDTVCCPII